MAKEQSFWYRLASGFVIGFGMVIPGVSGGVLAMVLGLYEPIIAAIANPLQDWRRNLRFLAPLGIGAAVCLLFLARLLEYLFAQHPLPTLYLFFGLVIASLPSMVRLANEKGFRLSYLVSLAAGLSALLLITSLPRHLGEGGAAQAGLVYRALMGGVLGVGLVVPGLSASFLLIAFGYYEKLLKALVNVDLAVLVPVGLGLGLTVLFASKVIHWLFRWQYGYVSYAIVGLMLGSLYVAFPGLPRTLSEYLLCLVLFACGVGLASLFLRKQDV